MVGVPALVVHVQRVRFGLPLQHALGQPGSLVRTSSELPPFTFLGKTLRSPIWVSSMTGGSDKASAINRNLAMACKRYGMGMGLGSCRSLLENNNRIGDFDFRKIIGDDLPFYANLGICQVEQLIDSGKTEKISALVDLLQTDGLIVHINPLQEWFQPEGDRIKRPPIDIIKRLLDTVKFPVIIKEVGQGFGPESLKALLSLPLEAIEFGAFGGTNFSELERLRNTNPHAQMFEPLCYVGSDAEGMLQDVNSILSVDKSILCRQIIISGGISNFLDGYYLIQKSALPAIYGQASTLLRYAKDGYEPLCNYIEGQLKGFLLAKTFLKVK